MADERNVKGPQGPNKTTTTTNPFGGDTEGRETYESPHNTSSSNYTDRGRAATTRPAPNPPLDYSTNTQVPQSRGGRQSPSSPYERKTQAGGLASGGLPHGEEDTIRAKLMASSGTLPSPRERPGSHHTKTAFEEAERTLGLEPVLREGSDRAPSPCRDPLGGKNLPKTLAEVLDTPLYSDDEGYTTATPTPQTSHPLSSRGTQATSQQSGLVIREKGAKHLVSNAAHRGAPQATEKRV
jgi:hypothetical protein